MNRKQIIYMWLGIAAFVLVGLGTAIQGNIYLWKGFGREAGGDLLFPPLFVLWLCIIVVTSGLICTFRDKKNK